MTTPGRRGVGAPDQRLMQLIAAAGGLVRTGLETSARARLTAELAVPDLADHAQVFVLEPDKTLRVAGMAHADAAVDARVASAIFPLLDVEGPSAAAAATRSGTVVVRTGQPDDGISKALEGLDRDLARALAAHSIVAVPLVHGAETVGALLLGRATGPVHDEEDVALARELAATAGPAIANALRFERERSTGETLQLGLLPQQVVTIEGLQVAARYVPAGAGVQVGGDWYDVLDVGDGGALFVVGDVVGHGAEAALVMGRIRTVLQLAAADEHDPASLLARANAMMCRTFGGDVATVAVARFDRAGSLAVARAGHVPPVIVDVDGQACAVEVPAGPPLGADPAAHYESRSVPFGVGDAVVLCTDGLLARPPVTREPPDGLDGARSAGSADPAGGGINRLVAECDGEPVDDPYRLVDRLLIRLLDVGARTDDVAVVVARLAAADAALSVVVPVEPRSLGDARRHLKAWLRRDPAIDDTTVEDVVLAASEALANAVEHAYVDRSDGRITLDASRRGQVIDIRVTDDGTWRDEWGGDHRGRGIALMGKLMDDVAVDRGEAGTAVTLRKRA